MEDINTSEASLKSVENGSGHKGQLQRLSEKVSNFDIFA